MHVLSHFQASRILAALDSGAEQCNVSLDLGISESLIALGLGDACLPDGSVLSEKALKNLVKEDTSCFLIEKGSVQKIERYSAQTRRYYKLVPTGSAPTLELSGIRMHRTKEVNPWEDTEAKIRAVAPVRGRVLDTCTGLGYTAILASRTAEEVVTMEIDENVAEIARLNPWSRELFQSRKIHRILGDAQEEVRKLDSNLFTVIIHDPPRFALAGGLYSEEFYRQLFRVLKKGGRLFHYTGSPGEKRGRDLAAGVIQRLRRAGFRRIARRAEAAGVSAAK